MNEISFSFLSRVHIWSAYSTKIHLAANEIIFLVISGYNRTVRILVISNLCTSICSICAINIWNNLPIAFNLLDNNCNIQAIKMFTMSVIKKGNSFLNEAVLSEFLFKIFQGRIMCEVLDVHESSISIGGWLITNFRFADDIVVNAEEKEEAGVLVDRLDTTTTRYKMEIGRDKIKVMTNNPNGFQREIKIKSQRLEKVEDVKCLGVIISNEESKHEILSRIVQTTAALSRLKIIWRDKNISLASKVKLMRTLILSIFLYACESWTLTAGIERRIQALAMRCYRSLLNISYKDNVTNEEVRNRIQNAIGVHDDLLTMVKKWKLRWYGHISRSSGMAKTILQGTIKGARRRGRQKKKWADNIHEWTGEFGESLRATEDRECWKGIVATSSVVPRRTPRLREWDMREIYSCIYHFGPGYSESRWINNRLYQSWWELSSTCNLC